MPMTKREKILAAFTREGTPEFGAVVSYDTIFIRDHWAALTDVPWWHAFGGAADLAWSEDRKMGAGPL